MSVLDQVRSAGAAYAANGWSILACYRPRGGTACDCGRLDCPSPGKHPHRDVTPSVYASTTDPQEILTWPSDINIGVHLGQASGGLMAVDLDDAEYAKAFIDSGIADRTLVTRTGRGNHILVHTSGDTKGFNLTDGDGRPIGEVRGDGQLVVLPPSQHWTGAQYEWAGQVSTLESHESIADWLVALGEELGLAIKWSEKVDAEVPADVSVVPQPLPESIATYLSTDMGTLFTGKWGYEPADRSEFLYNAAMEVAEAYGHAAVPFEAETVASHVMWLHDTLNLNKYRGAKEFYRLGLKATKLHGSPNGAQPAFDTPSDSTASAPLWLPPDDGEYRWDETDGKLYVYRKLGNAKQARAIEVCNFLPEIVDEYEIDNAEEIVRDWKVRFTRPDEGEVFEMMLRSRERSEGAIGSRLESELPASFRIQPTMHKHIVPALKFLTEQAQRTHVYATTGWVEWQGQPVYLLPSAEGAIGAEGLVPEVRIEPEKLPDNSAVTFPGVRPYGRGFRLPADDEEKRLAGEAFVGLIEAGNVEKTVPVVLQVLAGPLIPAGVGDAPPLVHVSGGTGAKKTALSVAALSMFGTWIRDETPPPASWGGQTTVFGLRLMLHAMKDVTLLVDDYKVQTVRNAQGVIGLIQEYADRTGAVRGSAGGSLASVVQPRCVLLSNGEDKWHGQASAEARTIEVHIRGNDLVETKLDIPQIAIMRGELQPFGALYVRWVARNWERLVDGKFVTRVRDQRRFDLREQHPRAHGRVISTVATLTAVSDVVREFVASEYPEHYERVSTAIQAALDALLGQTDVRAEEVRAESPFRVLAEEIASAIQAQDVCLWPRGHTAESAAQPSLPSGQFTHRQVVGWWWDQEIDGANTRMVLLNRSRSYGWYLQRARSTGMVEQMSWRAVEQQAVDEFGAEKADRLRVVNPASGTVSQISGVQMPLDRLLDSGGWDHSRDEELLSDSHSQDGSQPYTLPG